MWYIQVCLGMVHIWQLRMSSCRNTHFKVQSHYSSHGVFHTGTYWWIRPNRRHLRMRFCWTNETLCCPIEFDLFPFMYLFPIPSFKLLVYEYAIHRRSQQKAILKEQSETECAFASHDVNSLLWSCSKSNPQSLTLKKSHHRKNKYREMKSSPARFKESRYDGWFLGSFDDHLAAITSWVKCLAIDFTRCTFSLRKCLFCAPLSTYFSCIVL